MKKKIVYISGAEVFSAADVRAAFDEVRATLNLDTDTILFGVPIDNMDAKTESVPEMQCAPDTAVITQPAVPEPVAVAPQEMPQPIQTPIASVPESEQPVESDSRVVPILSVLGGGAKVETVEPEVPDLTDAAPSTDNIEDILNDDMPTESTEQTLEELLEKMTPLREDVHIDQEEPLDTVATDAQDDATLENLASEFAKVQDTMPTPKKTPERGKISKLKNILPFKKIRRDDSGIMGDLFGWAGIAANDDDFSMPGFFTGVAAKK